MKHADHSEESHGLFPADVFLSHNQEVDVSEIALKLRTLGLKIVFDDDSTVETDVRLDELFAGIIRRSRFIVSCQRADHRLSDWCRFETESAAKIQATTGVARLLTLHLNEETSKQRQRLSFCNGDLGLEELAAFVSFHNHRRVTPTDFSKIRDRLASSEIYPVPEPVAMSGHDINRSLQFVGSIARNLHVSGSLDGYSLFCIRNSLLYIGAPALQSQRHSKLADFLATIVSRNQPAEDPDIRAELLYLSAMLSTVRPPLVDQALARASAEIATSILRDACHFAAVFSAGLMPQATLIDFIASRADALDGTAVLKSRVDNAAAPLGHVEKALLFERMTQSLLRKQKRWSSGRMETLSIQIFECLFDSPSPAIARPIDLNENEGKVLFRLLAALQNLVAASKSNEGTPLILLCGLYSYFLLPVLALGINSKCGVSKHFREVADYIHEEFSRSRILPAEVEVYEWYLGEASKDFPTTAFAEFLYRLAMANQSLLR